MAFLQKGSRQDAGVHVPSVDACLAALVLILLSVGSMPKCITVTLFQIDMPAFSEGNRYLMGLTMWCSSQGQPVGAYRGEHSQQRLMPAGIGGCRS